MLSKDKINLIKESINIVDYVSKFVDLKRVGTDNFFGICPFHSETNSSMSVSAQKQIFKCYGCGVGGDVFSFTMLWNKCTFYDSVITIAKENNITIEEVTTIDPFLEVKKLSTKVSNIYNTRLNTSSNPAKTYLYNRGITEDLIKFFNIGYSSGFDILNNFNNEYQLLQNLGILSTNEGVYFETFKNRVVFPLRSDDGSVLGFTARTINNSEKYCKYLNTKDTEIFKKSNTFYGWFEHKKSIKEDRVAIIVEGPTDVIALHKKGIWNAVATMGTSSFTEQHALKLKPFIDKVILMADGDTAGIKSIVRDIIILSSIPIMSFVAQLPQGSDPDSFSSQNTKEEIINLLKNSENSFIWLNKYVQELSNINERITIINDLANSINKINNVVVRGEWLKYASEIFNINLSKVKQNKITNIIPNRYLGNSLLVSESNILSLMLSNQNCLIFIKSKILISDFITDMAKKIASIIFQVNDIDLGLFNYDDDIRLCVNSMMSSMNNFNFDESKIEHNLILLRIDKLKNLIEIEKLGLNEEQDKHTIISKICELEKEKFGLISKLKNN
jgi:DNA primase